MKTPISTNDSVTPVVAGLSPARRRQRASNLMVGLSVVLVVIVIVAEVVSAVRLSQQITMSSSLGIDVAREKVVRALDLLRHRLREHADTLESQSRPDPAASMTVALLRGEMERMTFYMREYSANLHRDQVDDLYRDLRHYETVVDKLEAGTLYPPPATLDTDAILLPMLGRPSDSR